MSAENQQETTRKVVGRPFPPGVSGNPAGRPRGIDVRAEYARARGAEKPAETAVQIIEAMVVKALDGDTQAARIVLDRLCGPVRQEVDVAMDEAHVDEETLAKRLHAMLALAAAKAKQRQQAEAN